MSKVPKFTIGTEKLVTKVTKFQTRLHVGHIGFQIGIKPWIRFLGQKGENSLQNDKFVPCAENCNLLSDVAVC